MGTEVTQVLLGRFRTKARVPRQDVLEICSSISPHGQKRHRSFIEDDLVLAVVGTRVLVDWPGVGGGRIQPG